MDSIAQKYIQFMLDYKFYKEAADNLKSFILHVFQQLNEKMCGSQNNSVDKIYIEKEFVARVILSVETCVKTALSSKNFEYEQNSSKLENGGFTEQNIEDYQNYRAEITNLLRSLVVE